jgi:hypothetical protein
MVRQKKERTRTIKDYGSVASRIEEQEQRLICEWLFFNGNEQIITNIMGWTSNIWWDGDPVRKAKP